MTIDLQHNKIVKDTMSARFAESVHENLVPMIEDKYGDRAVAIQMYEDYISDGFSKGGAWYYPLTVLTEDGPLTEWIKWDMDKQSFENSVPYAYTGSELIKFRFADAPAEFSEKLEGRAVYCAPGGLKVRVDTVVPDPTFLAGKYSQTFLDEMSRQLTDAICSAMSIKTLEDSTLELSLVFAPETYMEHTSENVTYRRLLLSDKGSAPRDFWIKWTRLDGATAYSVADAVSPESILFEIGEDVSQKVREKEYRCLIRLGKDKYHNAMGRKNVTEWRELIKRAIRRGELIRVDAVLENREEDAALNEKLAQILGAEPPAPSVSEPETVSEDDEFAAALKKLAEQTMADSNDETEQTSEDFVFAGLDINESAESTDDEENGITVADDGGIDLAQLFDEISEEDDESEYDEELSDEDADDETDADAEELCESEEELLEEISDDSDALDDVRAIEPDEEDICEDAIGTDEPVADAQDAVATDSTDLEAKLRAEIEARVRLEYESRARQKAEEEAQRLRREQEILRIENEKLQAQMARERREQAIKEEELRAEEARLRAQIEVQLRAETRERERLAEAARIAVEEQRRLEAEHAKITKEREEELRRNEEERRAADDSKRAEQSRKAEADRIRREQGVQKQEQAEPIVEDTKYTYTSKVVRLVFRRSVDPNITARIHEIIKLTLEYYGKDKIYLKVKASVPDSETVCLEFIKIPMEEMQLLSNIIKVLGNSGLGIAKAIVE